MKPTFSSISLVASALAMVLLTGCSAMREMHREHHPETSSSQASQTKSSGASASSAGQMGMMESGAMCDMHEKLMSAKTPGQRQAMMDDRMKDMSQQMRQKNLEMMQEQCRR